MKSGTDAMTAKEQILYKLLEYFQENGVKYIPREQLAEAVGIDPVEILSRFPHAADLITALVETWRTKYEKHLKAIQEDLSLSSDKQLEAIFDLLTGMMYNANPSSLQAMLESFPNMKDLYLNFKYDVLLPVITANLKKGVREGIYSTVKEPEILALCMIEQAEWMYRTANWQILIRQDKDFSIQREMMQLLLRGLKK